MDGGQITALESSVKKLLTFNEKGGNIDFVAPEADETTAKEAPDGKEGTSKIGDARAMIHAYQEVREQIKMIEDRSII